MSVRIDLKSVRFEANERRVANGGDFEITSFCYGSGVAALRIKNLRGEIIVLPFQGHQIWRASFDGRDLTMRSMFDEPVANVPYLETYGAFFIHCGVTAIGPSVAAEDRFPLHGELPNAPYQAGWIEIDPAEQSCRIIGTYRHTVAFSFNYLATSTYELEAESALINVSLDIENLKKTPMILMYLAHANFRPVDHAELEYTAAYDAKSVRVRKTIPPHITATPDYKVFLERLSREPEIHHVLTPGLGFDPEVAFSIDMKADTDGFAHALQHLPDGTADYMRYRPAQAPKCIRWICRTPDQDAIGFAFPATSEVEGYSAEKKKGFYATVDGGKSWRVEMRLGALTRDEASAVSKRIAAVRSAL
jgi:hypothetical protein